MKTHYPDPNARLYPLCGMKNKARYTDEIYPTCPGCREKARALGLISPAEKPERRILLPLRHLPSGWTPQAGAAAYRGTLSLCNRDVPENALWMPSMVTCKRCRHLASLPPVRQPKRKPRDPRKPKRLSERRDRQQSIALRSYELQVRAGLGPTQARLQARKELAL